KAGAIVHQRVYYDAKSGEHYVTIKEKGESGRLASTNGIIGLVKVCPARSRLSLPLSSSPSTASLLNPLLVHRALPLPPAPLSPPSLPSFSSPFLPPSLFSPSLPPALIDVLLTVLDDGRAEAREPQEHGAADAV